MDQSNQTHKIVLMGFVALAATAAYVLKVLMQVLAATSGWFARIYDNLVIQHGLPAALGIGLFILFMVKPSIKKWGEEVVVEVSKVVWPSRKDTQQLTVAVTIIILFAGLVLGAFDVVSKGMVSFILNFKF
jgi:preprotein translocase subunit SecE